MDNITTTEFQFIFPTVLRLFENRWSKIRYCKTDSPGAERKPKLGDSQLINI